jgi:hypothetical protein
MKDTGRSLVVEFSADRRTVYVRMAPSILGNELGVQIAEIVLDKYSSDTERYQVVGQVLLESLQILSGSGAPLFSQSEDESFNRLVEAKANEGDKRAQRIMAGICEAKALEKRDASWLQTAEYWYRQVIAGGDEEAKRFFLSVWPDHKRHLLREIERRDT